MKANILNVKHCMGYSVNLLLLFVISRRIIAIVKPFLADPSGYVLYQWFFTLGFVGMLFALGLMHLIKPMVMNSRTVVFITACLAIGCVIIFGGAVGERLTNELVSLGACVLGVGIACSFALWQQVLAGDEIAEAAKCIALGTALMSLMGIVLFQAQNLLLYFCVVGVGIAVNCIFALQCMSKKLPGDSNLSSAEVSSKLSKLSGLFLSIWRYVVCVGIMGFASRVSQSLLTENTSAALSNFYLISAMVASGIVLVILRNRKAFSFQQIYGILAVLVTICFLSISFVDERYRVMIAGLVFLAFSLVSMLMVITTIQVSKSRNINPTIVFGFFAGSVYFISDVGPLLVNTLGQGLGFSQVVIASLSTIYLLSLATLALSSLRAGKNNTDRISESDSSLFTHTEDLSSSFTKSIVIQQDLIPVCCQRLKKTYQLTKREVEVLELMARGRDLVRIAETLYVSQNTVRTHCRNLYRKLGVHNKQEALDLLEQCKEELL